MSYTLSGYGTTFITTEEEYVGKAYNKDGVPTYGFGATYKRDGSAVEMGDEISREDAIDLFKWQITHVTDAIWNHTQRLTQWEVDALTSLLFNCGTGLLGPTHSLGQAISNFNFEAIANAILLYDMATIGGVRGPFLAARRQAEHYMFLGARKVTTPSGTFSTAAVAQ